MQVQLVGSHADEVSGGEAAVRAACLRMARAVHAEFGQYRAAQERELAELSSMQLLSEPAQQRQEQLRLVLSKPLRLSMTAIAVSAKTGQGFDILKQALVEVAFDKDVFPTFVSSGALCHLLVEYGPILTGCLWLQGDPQPGTYGAIYRKLLRSHPEDSSVSWDAMQQSAAQQSDLDCSSLSIRCVGSSLSTADDEDEALSEPEPEPEAAEAGASQLGLVGTLQCETEGWFTQFEDVKVELSRAGALTVKDTGTGAVTSADLTKRGTNVDEPKKKRAGHPFCVRVDSVDPPRKFVFDMQNAEQHQRWLRELRAAAGIQAAQAKAFRQYSFTVSTAEEVLKKFTIRHRNAGAVHKQLQAAGVAPGLAFPDWKMDVLKDFTHDEANWRRRAQELQTY